MYAGNRTEYSPTTEPGVDHAPLPPVLLFFLDLIISYLFVGIGVYNLLLLLSGETFDLVGVGGLLLLFCWLRLETTRLFIAMPRKVQGLLLLTLGGFFLSLHWLLSLLTTLPLTPLHPLLPWLYLIIFAIYVILARGEVPWREQRPRNA